MDQWARFEIDENLRDKLKALWKSPDRALLETLKDRMLDHLYAALRSCPKEDIDKVRAQMDAIEMFFAHVSQTSKEPAEIEADARATASYPGPTV